MPSPCVLTVCVCSFFASCLAVFVTSDVDKTLFDSAVVIVLHVGMVLLTTWWIDRHRSVTQDDELRSLVMRILEILTPYLDHEKSGSFASRGYGMTLELPLRGQGFLRLMIDCLYSGSRGDRMGQFDVNLAMSTQDSLSFVASDARVLHWAKCTRQPKEVMALLDTLTQEMLKSGVSPLQESMPEKASLRLRRGLAQGALVTGERLAVLPVFDAGALQRWNAKRVVFLMLTGCILSCPWCLACLWC